MKVYTELDMIMGLEAKNFAPSRNVTDKSTMFPQCKIHIYIQLDFSSRKDTQSHGSYLYRQMTTT
jgi:hypothetical protein